MHQFGWLSEGGGNFLNVLQKERGTQKRGVPSEKVGFPPWRKLWLPMRVAKIKNFSHICNTMLSQIIISYQPSLINIVHMLLRKLMGLNH